MLRTAYRIQPEFMPLEMGEMLAMGDIFYGSKSQYLLEFVIQPDKKGKRDYTIKQGKR